MIRPIDRSSDIDRVLDLSREFWDSACAEAYGSFDRDHTEEKLLSYLDRGACFIADGGGFPHGFLLLVEDTHLCNPGKIAAEVAWYVRPDARGGDGIALLKAAMRYCELKSISSLSMMYMQSSMPEAIEKIYDKLGFIKRESTYVRIFYGCCD